MSNQLNFFLDRLTAFVDLEMERGRKYSVLTFIRLLELFQKKIYKFSVDEIITVQ